MLTVANLTMLLQGATELVEKIRSLAEPQYCHQQDGTGRNQANEPLGERLHA